MKEQITRPKIEDFITEGSLQVVIALYKNAKGLYGYAKALDEYIDYLEATAPTDEERRKINFQKFHNYYMSSKHEFNESVLDILDEIVNNPQTK